MASGWSTPVDIYCERTTAALWAEPLNAATNAAFVVAAVAALALWRRSGRRGDWPALVLIAVTALVGVGSLLFHTVATRWAGLADVIPIMVFIVVYLVLALRRVLGLGLIATGAGLALFFAVSAAMPALVRLAPGPWASSQSYFPALIALVTVGAIGRAMPAAAGVRASADALLLAAGLFTVSLIARMADLPLCDALPSGTHFLWHLLNATVLYVLLRAAILHRAAA
ncbi:ceramidase domain-containing protein [Blastochloris viridis]|uniref:Arginine/ornithine antiporter ArcD n=1 Tax=Blastochloris viridis TaxID=1079 RepID=A0A0H5B6N8_BLAVI|nr:ceramidase domain-containing protein [Blastochloris viridis]ALK08876.1 Ceramidase [Blastochloris viridis]BAR97822.1 arginine/ornithine antiporter ArcD [Blastochloris viridis]CUU41537.1 Ceramidase [Blastochloris viridis]